MKHDWSFVKHDGSEEKLYSYKYDIVRDSLKLNLRLSEPEAKTKHKSLAQYLIRFPCAYQLLLRGGYLARFMEAEVRMG